MDCGRSGQIWDRNVVKDGTEAELRCEMTTLAPHDWIHARINYSSVVTESRFTISLNIFPQLRYADIQPVMVTDKYRFLPQPINRTEITTIILRSL
jgi:hypothetical protein